MGKIIVIDGLDGCGKATQADILYNKLKSMGKKVIKADFPNYESLSSGPVRMYLSGDISNNPNDINPYLASMFYAVDRGITYLKQLKEYYDAGYIIIADRYISANVIYQGSKFDSKDEAKEYFKWEYELETTKCGIPMEDITLALTLPIEVSQKLMSKRYNGDESKKDIHESNMELLHKSFNNLILACDYLPTIGINWFHIDCSDGQGWIKSLEEISDIVFEKIKPILES